MAKRPQKPKFDCESELRLVLMQNAARDMGTAIAPVDDGQSSIYDFISESESPRPVAPRRVARKPRATRARRVVRG